jgi:hypothetical protein
VLTEAEVAYTAGIIDGEGCLTAYMRPNGAIEIRVDVVNTSRELLDWLQSRWGGKIYTRKSVNARHKPQYACEIRRAAAIDMLRDVRPFLVAKAQQADVMIAMWEARGDGRKLGIVTDEMRASRQGFITQLRDLNRKGVASA